MTELTVSLTRQDHQFQVSSQLRSKLRPILCLAKEVTERLASEATFDSTRIVAFPTGEHRLVGLGLHWRPCANHHLHHPSSTVCNTGIGLSPKSFELLHIPLIFTNSPLALGSLPSLPGPLYLHVFKRSPP